MYTRVKSVIRSNPYNLQELTEYERNTINALFKMFANCESISFVHFTRYGSHRLNVEPREICIIQDSLTHKILCGGIRKGSEI